MLDGEKETTINKLKNLFIFKGDYYKKKEDFHYVFSSLSSDNKAMTKSNATKELKDFLLFLQKHNVIDRNIEFEDLFLDFEQSQYHLELEKYKSCCYKQL